MKNGIVVLLVNLHLLTVDAQSLIESWTFDTGDKVLASPVVDDTFIYVGSQNGNFYSLNAKDGSFHWKYETSGIIQAAALLTERLVFFESANIFYALDKMEGKLVWKFDTGMTPLNFEYEGVTHSYKIDFWDDKRSVGVADGNLIYVGSGNGTLYVFDQASGIVVKQYQSDDNSPIRSTPLIDGNIVYFGDWNGVVYAYNRESDELKWKKKTYRYDRPYPSFGGVVSSFVRHNDLLLFGARNHIMNVLYAETGEKEWTYIDPKGGWMVGDPVVYNDTLYIGGSDNLSMYAFRPKWGRYLWQHNGGLNIYTRPIVTDQHIIYSAGNGYKWTDPGAVYVLNRMTGEEITKFETPNAVFSSPIKLNDQIIFGCYDGKVYSLEL
ncbi:MAG: PQQ-binding-like beta-propeller repeat protein [Cyclobacteriaceae bacterium]